MDNQPTEIFKIDNDTKAEWALSKIREQEAEYNRLADICKAQIDFYKLKLEEYQKDLDSNTKYFKIQLEQYFNTVEHKKTKTAESYKLPSGTLKLKYKENIKKDEEKLLEWLTRAGKEEYIKTVKSASWGSFKKTLERVNGKYVTEDGEVVEGVEVECKGSEFIIE